MDETLKIKFQELKEEYGNLENIVFCEQELEQLEERIKNIEPRIHSLLYQSTMLHEDISGIYINNKAIHFKRDIKNAEDKYEYKNEELFKMIKASFNEAIYHQFKEIFKFYDYFKKQIKTELKEADIIFRFIYNELERYHNRKMQDKMKEVIKNLKNE